MFCKISIVGGAGMVGSMLAMRLIEQNYDEIVLLDINEQVAQGRTLDLQQSEPLIGTSAQIIGTSDWDAITHSHIIVLTAGHQRQHNSRREELTQANGQIVKAAARQIALRAPNAVVILFTNPLDIMTRLFLRESGFPAHRVIGQAGLLDSSRVRRLIAEACNVSPFDVTAHMIGNHSDEMFPIMRSITIAGISATEWISESKIKELVSKAVTGGAEVNRLMGQGSFIAASAAGASMVNSIAHHQRRVVSACVYADGHYGLKDVCIGLPIVLGRQGIERIVDIELTMEEEELLARAVASVTRQTALLQ